MQKTYLLIEPVVCRSDSGMEPAVNRINCNSVESVFAQAGIEIVWLEPRFLDYSAIRDGSVDVDSVVIWGIENGLWGTGVPRISLVLVNAINGAPGPRGLGMQSGSICFVAMTGNEDNPEQEAFTIAHEIGHCMGLIHSIDDPEVDDDIPCIMGSGEFSDRTGEGALQPSHIQTVRESPFLLFQSQVATGSNTLERYINR